MIVQSPWLKENNDYDDKEKFARQHPSWNFESGGDEMGTEFLNFFSVVGQLASEPSWI